MRWAILALLGVSLAGAVAFAQSMDHAAPMHGNMPTHDRMQGTMPIHMHGMQGAARSLPILPGQDAFGAVQEIVGILEADPATDWSKVNLDALREHLIDMYEVTLRANAAVQQIEGGIKVAVTGSDRTLAAIQRMLPDQARHLNGTHDWRVSAEKRPDGVLLIVTSSEPKQIAIIRGLGFAGVLASGSYHQMHHLAMARGEFMH
jgi:hypothetical protein